MRLAYAFIALVFLIGSAAAADKKPAGEPVYEENGKLFGYVKPKSPDNQTESECVPDDDRPYPLCFSFGDDGDGEDD